MSTLSIVTVSMNRTDHLRQSAKAVSLLPYHFEHIIVDWGSSIPIDRSELPSDNRIKLLRVENERDWWLTRAYNFGFERASGTHILKLDSDVIITESLFQKTEWHNSFVNVTVNPFGTWTFKEGLSGLFLLPKAYLNEVGGFNEYIKGWGYDEVDLLFRLAKQGCPFQIMNVSGIHGISHDASQRVEIASARPNRKQKKAEATIKALNQRNKIIASIVEWSAAIDPSHYELSSNGTYSCTALPEKIRLTFAQSTKIREKYCHVFFLHFWGSRGKLASRLPYGTRRKLLDFLSIPLPDNHPLLWFD